MMPSLALFIGHVDASPGSNVVSPGTKGSGPGSNGPLVPRLGSFPSSPERWATLAEMSAPVRARDRVRPDEMERVVVALCAEVPLSLAELSALTGKGPDRVRKVVQSLRGDDADDPDKPLRYLHPDSPSSPKQRYVAA